MNAKVTVNGKTENNSQQIARMRRENQIRMRFTSALKDAEQDYEDGILHTLDEVKSRRNAAIEADRKANGVVVTFS